MAGMDIQHTETSGVEKETLLAHISRISSYRDKLKKIVREDSYNSPESALLLPTDNSITTSVDERAAQLGEEITDVIVVGMGGSVRATQAVYGLLEGETNVRLHAIDTVSSTQISDVIKTLDRESVGSKNVAVCVVSKSGATTETLANAEVLLSELHSLYESQVINERVTVITKSGSQLEMQAEKQNIATLSIPEQVSGRFSGLSAVGLLPLNLAGISTKKLSAGAAGMRKACLSGRPTSDPAATIAAILFSHIEENTRIINHYFFSQSLRHFGRWSEQLYAESLGKQKNRRGETVFSGLYPVSSFAPEDLHATFQLQLAGPKNFFSIFVSETDNTDDLSKKIAGKNIGGSASSHLYGKTLGDIKGSLETATKHAFQEAGRPFISITVPTFSSGRIGQLMFLEELVVMYLGHLLEVNVFNQPQIEQYKTKARDLLTN